MGNIITGSFLTGPARLVTGAAVTMTNKDFAVQVATGGGNRVVTLPHINACRNRWFMIKVAPGSANDVVVTPRAGETIDGGGSLTMNLTSNSLRTILLYAPATGVDWWIGPGTLVP